MYDIDLMSRTPIYEQLYRKVIEKIEARGIHVEEGVFQAEMLVSIDNDGPVTILLESHKLF